MGFFDALKEGAKKLTDRVTGGYGKITFNLNGGPRNDSSARNRDRPNRNRSSG